MAYGIIGVPGASDITQPSATIWGDCPNTELLEEGSGFFVDKRFQEAVTLPDLPSSALDSGTFTQDANFDHALLFTTGATANDGSIIYARPTAAIAAGSGVKTWFEASISLQDVTEPNGIFVGLVNLLGMANTLVAAASVTAGSNKLTKVTSTSCVGFWMHGDQLGNFDAVYVNNISGTGGKTPATVNKVLSSTLTSPANTPDPGNPLFTPAAAPGVLTNNTKVKLGLRYDGQNYLLFYVNGAQVAKLAVSGTIDNLATYGPVVAMATGTSTAAHMDVHFFRYASKLF